MTSDWLAALPKVDLHVHQIGATSLETLAALAARHPEAGVPTDAEALASFYEFTDFAHFLRVYAAVSRLSPRLRTSTCSPSATSPISPRSGSGTQR